MNFSASSAPGSRPGARFPYACCLLCCYASVGPICLLHAMLLCFGGSRADFPGGRHFPRQQPAKQENTAVGRVPHLSNAPETGRKGG